MQRARQAIDVTATTITFAITGPTDDGGRPVKAYQVQYATEDQHIDDGEISSWTVGEIFYFSTFKKKCEHFFFYIFFLKHFF